MSSSSSLELANLCPCCDGKYRFSSVPELHAHLVSRHTYETLLLLSQTRVRSSRPVALLPLPSKVVAQRRGFPPGLEAQTLPLPLNYLDLASSSASVQLVRKLFAISDPGPPEDPSNALALNSYREPFPGRTISDVGVNLGLGVGLSLRIGLEERLGLGLNCKDACRYAEVEERVNLRVGQLETELRRREAELEAKRQDGEQLKREKQEVEERAAYLSREVSVAMEMMEKLRKALDRKEEELRERQRGMADIESFLRKTAEKETEAKSRLQVFIETLLERVDYAEQHLLLLNSQTTGPASGHTPGGRSMDTSTDDIITDMKEATSGYRRSYSVSDSYRLGDHLYVPHFHSGLTGHARTMSLGSEGWDADFRPCPLSWTELERGRRDAGRERFWMGDGDGRTWSRRSCRHHSTEEEDEEEEIFWSSSERKRLVLAKTDTPVAGSPSPQCTSSPHHGDRQLGVDSLRLRAGLFCIFPYLDVRSLLRAAEVCSDWRFVARHPAVWTRFRLEDARVSAEFLSTLSQWCTQTQSLVLNNLKPRHRQTFEALEDYHKTTRGIMEPGLEALLRSAGGSLLHLSVSQCPHILTERTLWLASCYCRNLQTLTYRSSSDPASQEVLWALGAGCRNITSLQVAPANLCQQPTRFGNRCLQTIGRCWPLLLSLSVGGAGCGTQGLVTLVRSCAHLQVLELECITDLGLQAATDICKAGLKSLEKLILKHTPVSGQAILHFHSECKNIRSITVEVLAADYFEEPDTQEARHLFREILATLKVLQMRPGLCDILEVNVEGFC